MRCKALLMVMFVFLACNSHRDAKLKGEAFLTSYFEGVRSHQYDTVLALYSPDFFKVTPKEKWRATLSAFPGLLGELQSYQLVNWQSKAKRSVGFGMAQDGTYMTFVYAVRYSLKSSIETFVLFIPKGASSMTIIAHNIKSEAFNSLVQEKKGGI